MANTARVVLLTVPGPRLVFEALGDKGTRLIMDSADEPEGLSPVETLLAALGGCGGMDVIGILRKKRQDVTRYEVLVRTLSHASG